MEDFANDACKTVVAQICEAVGFHAITDSALLSLSSILANFIDEIGYQSHSLAELSNRTQSNFLDVKAAVEEMGTTISELQRFMARNELRYAKADVPFPLVKNPRPRVRFGAEETEPLPPHIPSFLPPFPSKHTYLATPQAASSKADPRTAKKQKNKHRRQLEESLLKLTEAEKKPRTDHHYGLPNPDKEGSTSKTGDGTDDGQGKGEKREQDPPLPAVLEAARVNDALEDPKALEEIKATAPHKAGTSEAVLSTKARAFSLTLPSDARAIGEAESGRDADRDKERKRQKAAKILATQHDLDGVSAPPMAGGEAKSPALADDAMVEED